MNPEAGSRIFPKIPVLFVQFLTVFSFLVGCSNAARKKSEQLDSILIQTNRITHIEIGTIGVPITKVRLEQKRAELVLNALNKTNRVEQSSSGKINQKGWIILQEGTNEILVVEIYEEGVFAYDQYTFRLLSPINYSEPNQ